MSDPWKTIKEICDDKNHVKKYVFTSDNAVAESVLYQYPDYLTRTVICFSVQSGCPVGCRFCGTGDYFVRNLTTEEIVGQVEYSLLQTNVDPNKIKKLQLMSMSMGEPMLNLKNLIPALEELGNRYPNADLLVSSTAPNIGDKWGDFIEFATRNSKVGLQFSVHETTNEKRNELIPFKTKLTLEEISVAGTMFYLSTSRHPFFNYCAHEENSTEEDADRLLELFPPEIFKATISVICERSDGMNISNSFQRSLATRFAEKMVYRGFDVRVFDPAGQDTIGGGCGQLKYVQEWFVQNPKLARSSIGNSKPIIHMPIDKTD